jgi:hypothetical protein
LNDEQELPMAKKVNIEGRLISRTVNVGSKSERAGYFIVTDTGDEKPVGVRGENPFEQPTLRALVGSRCRAEDCVLHGTTYVAEKVVPA